MAKKPTTTAVVEVEAKSADVGAFEISADVVQFAAGLGVDLAGSLDDRTDRAAEHMNRSQRHMLASGLLLASVKAECAHGEFQALIQERGFEGRAAQKAMQYAQFIVARTDEERALLIGLPKSKVLALASADQEVIEHMLSDGGERIDALSVRALQEQIRELQAGNTDLTVQRDTAEAELEAARKRLAKATPDREDKVPLVVADLRAEIVALQKKAELAISSFQGVGMDVMQLIGTEGAHEWADATLRLAVAALAALQLQTHGLLKMFLKELPGEDATPSDRSRFTQQEVLEAARRFAELTQLHDYEKVLREWEREQARPRGKGRPSAKPDAPKGGA